jgi:hypothetical protein
METVMIEEVEAQEQDVLAAAQASPDIAIRSKGAGWAELGKAARAVAAAREAFRAMQEAGERRLIPFSAKLDQERAEAERRIADAQKTIATYEAKVKAAEDALRSEQAATAAQIKGCQDALEAAEAREDKAKQFLGLSA